MVNKYLQKNTHVSLLCIISLKHSTLATFVDSSAKETIDKIFEPVLHYANYIFW